jgi:opacity protein-like surface antigen
MKKLFLASVMVTATMMTQAGAADMAVKAPRAAPIAYSDWSGFYVGIEGGYGWGRNRYDDGFAGLGSAFQGNDIARLLSTGTGVINGNPFTGPSISTVNNNGFLAGGFFGAQKQYGSWVFGIEGDIDGANLKGSSVSSLTGRETVVRGAFGNPTVTLTGPGVDILLTKCRPERLEITAIVPVPIETKCKTVDLNDFLKKLGLNLHTDTITVSGPLLPDGQTTLIRELANANVTRSVSVDTKLDLLSSVRGKVGFAAWDSVLLYGTGGLALAHGTNTVTVTQQTTLVGGPAFAAQSFTGSAGSTMFGWAAGGGIDFKWPGTGFIVGLEYLHYDFAKNTFAISDSGGVGRNFNAHQSVDAIKGRLSYLFPIH